VLEVLYLPTAVVVTGYNSAMSACQKGKHWMLGLQICWQMAIFFHGWVPEMHLGHIVPNEGIFM